jgi:hypothetical protein
MNSARSTVPGLSSADLALLRAALGEGDVARMAYRRWRESIDWERLPVVWQRLLPLLHHNVSRLGVEDPLLERFRGVRRYFWARNLRLMALAKRMHEALAAARIPALALKGTSLVASSYVDRSIRPMEDVDVLVPRTSVEAAIAVLERLGFEPDMTAPRCLRERLLRTGELPGCAFRDRGGDYVDLHWNALHLDRRLDADGPAWSRSREVMFEGVPVRVLDPADQLLQLCAHGLQDTELSAIRWIADAAIVIRGTTSLDWSSLADCAAHHRLSAAMANAFLLLRQVVSLPIPSAVIDRLRQQSSMEERVEAHLRRHARRTARFALSRALLGLAYFRRGRAELFHRGMSQALGPWLRATTGTRTVQAALGRVLYWILGHPALRRLLAPDRSLAVPPAGGLPTLGDGIDLTSCEAPEALFVHGWSIAERRGRWTEGRSAILAWNLPVVRSAGIRVRLRAVPLLHSRHRRVDVSVFVGDVRVGRQRYRSRRAPGPHITCVIPGHLIREGAPLVLVIEIRKPIAPLAIGVSGDQRALGIMLQQIEIVGLDPP